MTRTFCGSKADARFKQQNEARKTLSYDCLQLHKKTRRKYLAKTVSSHALCLFILRGIRETERQISSLFVQKRKGRKHPKLVEKYFLPQSEITNLVIEFEAQVHLSALLNSSFRKLLRFHLLARSNIVLILNPFVVSSLRSCFWLFRNEQQAVVERALHGVLGETLLIFHLSSLKAFYSENFQFLKCYRSSLDVKQSSGLIV